MAEYINKKALLKEVHKIGKHPWSDWETAGVISLVCRQPAADVVPVVHGRWIEKPFLLGTSNFCSLCDSFYGMPHGKFNYCPNCGARMDGE